MYRNILVYIDSGLPSLAVGKIAIKISEHFRSKTYLFSVISKAERKENILKIEHSVKTLFEEALEKNIPVEEQI
ncbi:MAG: hypothetical protein N2999_07210, partial [Proteobacteria bacterium]|nr:hypothetical protein [Pseudomonadota bacterium]